MTERLIGVYVWGYGPKDPLSVVMADTIAELFKKEYDITIVFMETGDGDLHLEGPGATKGKVTLLPNAVSLKPSKKAKAQWSAYVTTHHTIPSLIVSTSQEFPGVLNGYTASLSGASHG